MTCERMDKQSGETMDERYGSGTYTTSVALPAEWQKQLRELAINAAAKTKRFTSVADVIREAIQKTYGFKLGNFNK